MSVVDVTEYGYHSDQIDPERVSVSRSTLHTLLTKSPAHARAGHPRLNPEWEPTSTTAFDVGSAVHELLLGGPGVQVVEHDSWRSNAAKESRDLARQHGLIPLLTHEWHQVNQMHSALVEQMPAGMFEDGEAEVTIAWEDRGVLCRARLDWLTSDRLAIHDLKTSHNAEPSKWSRSMFDHGYDIQSTFYVRGVRAVFGTEAQFVFAVIEKEPPHPMAVFQIAPDTLELANRKIDWALDVWRGCMERDEWPAYSTRTHWVTLPPWAEPQWFDREAREEVAA